MIILAEILVFIRLDSIILTMKISIAIIALIASSNVTALLGLNLGASTQHNCVAVNAALAVQIADITQLVDQLNLANTVDQTCQTVVDLAESLTDVIESVPGTVIVLAANTTSSLKISGLNLGGLLGGLVGGLLQTVNNLLASVLGLVNLLVGDLLQTTCGVASNVVQSIKLGTSDINALVNINLCLDLSNLQLINLKTNVAVQLDAAQAQVLINQMNSVNASAGANAQTAVNINVNAVASANASA